MRIGSWRAIVVLTAEGWSPRLELPRRGGRLWISQPGEEIGDSELRPIRSALLASEPTS